MLRRLSTITATVGVRASLRRLSGRPSSSSLIEETKHLVNLTQQLGSATLTLHADVKELTLENQQLRRGVIALVRAMSDKAVAASPALWTLRDQVIRLEQVQVLAERLEAAKPSTAAAVTTPKAWLAGRGAPENARLHTSHEIEEIAEQVCKRSGLQRSWSLFGRCLALNCRLSSALQCKLCALLYIRPFARRLARRVRRAFLPNATPWSLARAGGASAASGAAFWIRGATLGFCRAGTTFVSSAGNAQPGRSRRPNVAGSITPKQTSPNSASTARSTRVASEASMVALVLMVAEKPSLALVAPYSTHWSGLEPGVSTSSARSLSRYPGRRSPGISRVSRTRRATAARPTCTSSAAPSAAGQRPSASPRSRATCTTSSSHLSGGRARCLPSCADSPLLSERPALTRSARVALLTPTHPSHRLLPVWRAQGGVGC